MINGTQSTWYKKIPQGQLSLDSGPHTPSLSASAASLALCDVRKQWVDVSSLNHWELSLSMISTMKIQVNTLYCKYRYLHQLSSVQSLSHVWLFATPWTAACQASLSITNSQSLLKLIPIESVMPSSHLILCRPLLLLPPIPPSIRVFSNESTLRMRWSKYWSFSFSIRYLHTHIKLREKNPRILAYLIHTYSFQILFCYRLLQDINIAPCSIQ